jgi:capsular polysaccharide biosynthesis protein
MRAAGTDALGVLRWGLRRYRALMIVCLLLGAAVAPFAALQRDIPTDAQALVVVQRLDMDLVALPRYGDAVFNNGSVAQAVAAQFGDLGDFADIIPNRVSLVAEQDSIVFAVVGHDVNPKTAADIANVAANTFVTALNSAGVGVGSFTLQSPAQPPPVHGNSLGTFLAIPVGVVAGLVLGLAAVSTVLVARRPVIDGADAEDATGVLALGTVTVPRTRRGTFARPADFTGLVPVCRRLLALPTPIIVLASRAREEPVRKQLAMALVSVLRRVRDVRFLSPSDLQGMPAVPQDAAARQGRHGGGSHDDDAALTFVDSGEPLDLIQPPQLTTTVLVVREGIGTAALRAAVVEHLGGSAEARLLMVKRGRRARGESANGVERPGDEQVLEPAGRADNP